jgi:hypothetical protein
MLWPYVILIEITPACRHHTKHNYTTNKADDEANPEGYHLSLLYLNLRPRVQPVNLLLNGKIKPFGAIVPQQVQVPHRVDHALAAHVEVI